MSRKRHHSFDVSAWPGLPRLPGLFVTGAGLAPGKTLVAGAIARHLRDAGRDVEVFLPVACGCRLGRGGLVSHEADFLAACAESKRTLADIAPVRFAAALTPLAAAREAGVEVDLEAVFDAWRRLAGQARAAIVEGPGGLLSPITEGFWTVHLARMLALPTVVVFRPGAGAVEQVLLTDHAARSAGLNVAGLVVNGFRQDAAAEPDVDVHMRAQPELLAGLTHRRVLAVVPEDPANRVAAAALAASARFAIDQGPWEEIIFPPSR